MRLNFAHTRAVAALAAVACMSLVAPTTALAVDTTTRTAADIQAQWQRMQPVYTGSPYAVAPNVESPYSTGTLATGFLVDGLDTINYCRYLAGLPYDVTLDPTYTDSAQHGAVLLQAAGFSHTPPKPADMDQSFYNIAENATSKSNIGLGYGQLSAFNFSCMSDSDSGNIDRLGHRRWILYPLLGKTGMGYADNSEDTYVFDWSRVGAVAYDTVKWPAAGAFPTEVFAASDPWSVTLNPATYSYTTGTAGHVVTLYRERDGMSWTFTSANTNKNGQYFNFDTNGYGVADCFVFRPDPSTIGRYTPGDVYDVSISGGITLKSTGAPATIKYSTRFISQVAGSTDTTLPELPSCSLTTPRVSGAIKNRRVTLAGTLAPGHSASIRVQINRLVGRYYRSYKVVWARSSGCGAWHYGVKLPKGYFSASASVPITASYKGAGSGMLKFRVR
jgi:uncharacterized protein YkwD